MAFPRRVLALLAPIAMLVFLLVLASTQRKTTSPVIPDRDIDQYEHSGYAWPKLLLWRGIRTSPGVMWFTLPSFVGAAVFAVCESLIRVLMMKVEALGSPSATEEEELWLSLISKQEAYEILDTMIHVCLGSSLLYMSLAVTRLSDLMEAYLVSMCAVQLILDSRRTREVTYGGLLRDWMAVQGFLLASLFGITMLDSYHRLNALNTAYSVLGSTAIILTSFLGLIPAGDHGRKKKGMFASVVHFIFPVAALYMAQGVEGAHRGPMLAYLWTAGATSVIISLIVWFLVPEPAATPQSSRYS